MPSRSRSPQPTQPALDPITGAFEDTRGVHVWLIVMKTHRTLQRHANQSITEFGFGFSDFSTLEALLHKGPQSVSEIARRVGLTPGSASIALDRLERRGLIARETHLADRRNRIIHLTPNGRRLIEKTFAHHAEAMERAMAQLAVEERSALVRLLKRLGKGAQEALPRATREKNGR